MPDEATWQAIERAYCESDERVVSIANRMGVPAGTIYYRARSRKWPRRQGRRSMPGPSETVEAARNAVMQQLYRRMSQRLTQMELGAEGGRPAADDTDERMLTQLIRQFEKLTGLDGISERERGQGKDRRAQSGARDTSRDKSAVRAQQSAPPDAERLRQDIVQRLERLHADRTRKDAAE